MDKINQESKMTIDHQKNKTSNSILISLFLSRFSTVTPSIIAGLLLLDIGSTFNVNVGVMGQIQTVSSLSAVFAAVIIGVISVKINDKTILIWGLIFLTVSALLSGFAFNFVLLLILYGLNGIGGSMVQPMTATLVTNLYPLEKRGGVMGWLMASLSIAYFVGAIVIGTVATIFGWRYAFLGYSLPIFIISLLLVLLVIPKPKKIEDDSGTQKNYLDGFRAIYRNRSASSSLIVVVFAGASWQAILLYSASYFRQRFLISTSLSSIMLLFAAVSFTVGAIMSGRIINKYGRKPISITAAILAGSLTMIFTFFPNFYLSQLVVWMSSFFVGMRVTAFTSLELEQVPEYRGTMMSIDTAFTSFGTALGSLIGGLAISLYGYELMAGSLGVLHIIAAVLIYLFVTDPTKNM